MTTDIIVGFPGETEAEFAETLEVVEEVGFDGAFTFIYSPRRDTEAAEFVDEFVAHEVQVERMERLVEVVQRRARERAQRFVGRTLDVLVEGALPARPVAPARPHHAQQGRQLRRPGVAGRDRAGRDQRRRRARRSPAASRCFPAPLEVAYIKRHAQSAPTCRVEVGSDTSRRHASAGRVSLSGPRALHRPEVAGLAYRPPACEHVFVRWESQTVSTGRRRPPAGPGRRRVVRRFDAPEALDMRFHEVRTKSALNHVPGGTRGCRSTGRSTRTAAALMPACTAWLRTRRSCWPTGGRERSRTFGSATRSTARPRRRLSPLREDRGARALVNGQAGLPGHACEDGTELVASGDHRFLSRRGWKHVTGASTAPTAARI